MRRANTSHGASENSSAGARKYFLLGDRTPNSVHHLARLYAKCTKSPSFVGQQTAQNARHEKRLCSQLTTALLVSVAHVGDGGEKLG